MKPLGYEIINLGSDNPISITQAISKLENTIGKKADIVFEPTHPADIFATWADIDKAKAETTKKPYLRVEGLIT